MAELDSRQWPAAIAFECYGTLIGLRVSDRDILSAVLDFLPPLSREIADACPQVDRIFSVLLHGDGQMASVYENEVEVGPNFETPVALRILDSYMQDYIAAHAPQKVFVHAGVVAWKDRAMIFPGESFAGKTTLVRALVERGAVYFSDEYAVVDSAGLVHPYPRALCVRTQRGDVGNRLRVEDMGGQSGAEPVPVGLVCVTTYVPGSSWRPETRSRGRGVLTLLEHSFRANKRPVRTLTFLRRALRNARVIEGERPETEQIIDDILAAVPDSVAA